MAENMDDRALEEQMRGLLDDGRDMAEFGASDAACYLYPEADQGPLREAFCRGAGYDHVRVVTLTRQLEAAKGALKAAGPHVCSALCASVKQTGSDWTHSPLCNEIVATLSTPAEKPEAVETGDDLTKPFEPVYVIDRENGLTQYVHEDVAYVAHAIGVPNVCDALLALDDRRLIGVQFWFTPPEAVETGEPVAWRDITKPPYAWTFETAYAAPPSPTPSTPAAGTLDGSTYSAIEDALDSIEAPLRINGEWLTLVERIRAIPIATPPSPTPPTQDDARTRALEEAAKIVERRVSGANDAKAIAAAIRALAAIPTAGDAK